MWQMVHPRPIPYKISFIWVYLQSADRSDLHRTGWSSRLNKLYTLVWEEIVKTSRKQSVFLRELPETHPRATLNFKALDKYSYIKDSREQRRITEYSRKVGGSWRLRSSGLTMYSHLPWRRRQQIFRKVGTFPSDYAAFHPTTPQSQPQPWYSQIFQECRIPGCENIYKYRSAGTNNKAHTGMQGPDQV
jgi:hypothetical protein